MNPGTVSKILWHFTGGPLWNEVLGKQENKPKPMELAFDILIKILESKQLRISNYSELIRVLIPEISFWNWEERRIEKKYNVEQMIKSSSVCCLADIPIQHLDFHSKRYGKFAIGFHRSSAIKNNFNPVFYSLFNSEIMKSIYSGFSVINSSTETFHIKRDLNEIEMHLGGIQNKINKLNIDSKYKYHKKFNFKTAIDEQIDTLESEIKETKKSIANFVAFVKTFNEEEFNSIYCEREWRSIQPFNFKSDDIAMIILPREGGFFEKIIKLNIIPRNISIIPWEDLIEH